MKKIILYYFLENSYFNFICSNSLYRYGSYIKKLEVGKTLTEKINQLNNNHIVKFREIENKLIAKEKLC